MRVVPLLLSLTCMLAAEEAIETPVPAAAKVVLDKLAKTEEKLDQEHLQAVSVERQKAIDALQKVLKDATKTGDLDAANAVKARIDGLKAKNEADNQVDVLGNKKEPDPKTVIIGSWDFDKSNGMSGTIEFVAGGGATARAGALVVPGHWEMVKENRIHLVWFGDPSHWEEFAFTDRDKLLGDSSDAGQKGFRATRQKAK